MPEKTPIGRLTIRRRQFLYSICGSAALPAIVSSQVRHPLSPAFPQPKYTIGQEVLAPWVDVDDDDVEHLRHNRAVIIAAAYEPTDWGPGWWYLPRWLDLPVESSLMLGRDDGIFCREEQLKALGD